MKAGLYKTVSWKLQNDFTQSKTSKLFLNYKKNLLTDIAILHAHIILITVEIKKQVSTAV